MSNWMSNGQGVNVSEEYNLLSGEKKFKLNII